MKTIWRKFVNFCLLIIGIRLAYYGVISLIHFNAIFSFPEKTVTEVHLFGITSSGFNNGYGAGYRLGFIIGYFIRIPIAIALLSLFYERVFKKSKSK